MSDRSAGGKPWQTISSRQVHETPWLKVREDQVEIPGGGQTTYTVVDCGECVGVLPFVDPEHVILVRQYRYVTERYTWEMPTGGVHDGETPEQAAQRELAEEAGHRARSLERVSIYDTSKSCMKERAYLYLGRDLEPAEARPDETEQIRTRVFPLSEVLAMVLDGTITDSMTIIAVLMAERSR